MAYQIPCACCKAVADNFFHSLDNCLWAACNKHRRYFEATMVELDPTVYDLQSYLAENAAGEDEYQDDRRSPPMLS